MQLNYHRKLNKISKNHKKINLSLWIRILMLIKVQMKFIMKMEMWLAWTQVKSQQRSYRTESKNMDKNLCFQDQEPMTIQIIMIMQMQHLLKIINKEIKVNNLIIKIILFSMTMMMEMIIQLMLENKIMQIKIKMIRS